MRTGSVAVAIIVSCAGLGCTPPWYRWDRVEVTGRFTADGRLSDHETHLVRKMASLMQLEPAYLAEARRAAAGGASG